MQSQDTPDRLVVFRKTFPVVMHKPALTGLSWKSDGSPVELLHHDIGCHAGQRMLTRDIST